MSDHHPDEDKVEDKGVDREENAKKYGLGLRDLTATLDEPKLHSRKSNNNASLAMLTSSVNSVDSVTTSAAVAAAVEGHAALPDVVESCFNFLKEGQKAPAEKGGGLLDKLKENAERSRLAKKHAEEAAAKKDVGEEKSEESKDADEATSAESSTARNSASISKFDLSSLHVDVKNGKLEKGPKQRSSSKNSYVDLLSGSGLDSDLESEDEDPDLDMSKRMKDLMNTSTGEQRNSALGSGLKADDNCKRRPDVERSRSERNVSGEGKKSSKLPPVKRTQSNQESIPKPHAAKFMNRSVSADCDVEDGPVRGVSRTRSGASKRGERRSSDDRSPPSRSPSRRNMMERTRSSRNVSRSPRRPRTSLDGETDPPAMKRNLSSGSTGSGGSPKQRSSTGASRTSPSRSPRKKGDLDAASEHVPKRRVKRVVSNSDSISSLEGSGDRDRDRGERRRGVSRTDSSSSVGSAAKRHSRGKPRPMLGRSDSEGSAGESETRPKPKDLNSDGSGNDHGAHEPERRRARDARMTRTASSRNLSPSRAASSRNLSPSNHGDDLAEKSAERVRSLQLVKSRSKRSLSPTRDGDEDKAKTERGRNLQQLSRGLSKRSLSPKRRDDEDLEDMTAIPMPNALTRGVSAGNPMSRRAPLEVDGEEALKNANSPARVPRRGVTRSMSEKGPKRHAKPASDMLPSTSDGEEDEPQTRNSTSRSPGRRNHRREGDRGRYKSSRPGDELATHSEHRRRPRRKPTDDGSDPDLSPDQPRRKPRRKPTDDGSDPDLSPDQPRRKPRRRHRDGEGSDPDLSGDDHDRRSRSASQSRVRPEDKDRKRRARRVDSEKRSHSPTRPNAKSRSPGGNRGRHQFDIAKNQFANMVQYADEQAEQEEEEEKKRQQEEEEERLKIQALEEAAALAEAEAEEEAKKKKKGLFGVAKFAAKTATKTAKLTANVATSAASTGVNLASTAASTGVNLASTAASTGVNLASTAASTGVNLASTAATTAAGAGLSTVKGAVNVVSDLASSQHVKTVQYDIGEPEDTHRQKREGNDRLQPAPSISVLAGGVLGGSSALLQDSSLGSFGEEDDGAIE